MSVSSKMPLWTDELISSDRVLPSHVFFSEDAVVTAGKHEHSWITFSTSLKNKTKRVEPLRFGKVTQRLQI